MQCLIEVVFCRLYLFRGGGPEKIASRSGLPREQALTVLMFSKLFVKKLLRTITSLSLIVRSDKILAKKVGVLL